jgi:hypothetical protein
MGAKTFIIYKIYRCLWSVFEEKAKQRKPTSADFDMAPAESRHECDIKQKLMVYKAWPYLSKITKKKTSRSFIGSCGGFILLFVGL